MTRGHYIFTSCVKIVMIPCMEEGKQILPAAPTASKVVARAGKVLTMFPVAPTLHGWDDGWRGWCVRGSGGYTLLPASISFSWKEIFPPNKERQGTCQDVNAVCQQGLAQNTLQVPQLPKMLTRDEISPSSQGIRRRCCSWLVRLMSVSLRPGDRGRAGGFE